MDQKFLVANHLVPDNEVWVSPNTFENPFSKDTKEALNSSHNTASPKLLSQLGIVEVLLRQEDCGAAHANVVALIEQLRASA